MTTKQREDRRLRPRRRGWLALMPLVLLALLYGSDGHIDERDVECADDPIV